MNADHNNSIEQSTDKRKGGGGVITILLIGIVVVVAILFMTGFWSAKIEKSGALPSVAVTGGALPEVDLKSKQVVVGTKQTNVALPTVETRNTSIDVPVVAVKDSGEK